MERPVLTQDRLEALWNHAFWGMPKELRIKWWESRVKGVKDEKLERELYEAKMKLVGERARRMYRGNNFNLSDEEIIRGICQKI